MQIQILAPQLSELPSFRDSALARARSMLRRAAGEVIQARIQLHDLNGPRGGVDQQCRVALLTRSHGLLVVTSRAGSAGAALALALHRAVQSLVRSWQRRRKPGRQRLHLESGTSRSGVPAAIPPGRESLPGAGEASE